MSKDNGTEYVFIKDGVERYEIVFAAKEAFQFGRMHKTDLWMPLKTWEETKKRLTEGAYIMSDQPFQCPRCGARTMGQDDGTEKCLNDGLSFKTTTEYEL